MNCIKVFDVENFKITTVILFILENYFLVNTVNTQQSLELVYIGSIGGSVLLVEESVRRKKKLDFNLVGVYGDLC